MRHNGIFCLCFQLVSLIWCLANASGCQGQLFRMPGHAGAPGLPPHPSSPAGIPVLVNTATAPTIDGTVENAWSQAAQYPISTVIRGTVDSTDDLSGSWQALWNNDGLFLLVTVQDETLVNDSDRPYEDDAVELFLDGDNTRSSSYDQINDAHYQFRWQDGTVHKGTNSIDIHPDITFVLVAVGDGYVMELFVPWSAVNVQPRPGDLVGLDIQIIDDDDGAARDGKIAWKAVADDSWLHPRDFGQVALGDGSGTTNLQPTVVLVADPVSGAPPLDVTFDASQSTDPDGTIASYHWDLGDGQVSTQVNLTHTYASVGAYQVTLTVTDNERSSRSDSTTIRVEDVGVPPSGLLGTDFGFRYRNYVDKPFIDNVDFAQAWTNKTNIWNPDFLDELKQYSTLRFLNWSATNNSKIERWSQRRLPEDPGNDDIGYQSQDSPLEAGMAYEWIIDLCNRARKDCWLNIPHAAEWDYSRELAQLVFNRLDPSLKAYLEYSNETWNTYFAQADYCEQKGQSLNLSNPRDSYHVYAAVRHFKNFDDVFAGQTHRIVKVISGFVLSAGLASRHMDALADSTVNPDNVQIDGYAIAPYFGHSVNGASSSAVDQLRDDIDNVSERVDRIAAVIRPKGYKLFAYEGGQHVTTNAAQINEDPRIYDLTLEYLNEVAIKLDLFMYYLHCSRFTDNGAWGAMKYTGQPLSEAHKFRAILDFLKSQP